MAATVRITQRRSANGASPAQRDTLRTLGLRGIGRSTERPDSPQLRGMLSAVAHLVQVEEGSRRSDARAQKDAAKEDGDA